MRASHIGARHAERSAADAPVKTRALVAVERSEPPFFEAIAAPWRREPTVEGEGAAIGADAAEDLGLKEGDSVWILPLD